MAGLGPTDGAVVADGADGAGGGTPRGGRSSRTTFRAIGISPHPDRNAFDTFDGNQWPPVSPPLNTNRLPAQPGDNLAELHEIFLKAPITGFPRRAWTSYHYSIAVLGEFVQQQNANNEFWHQLAIAEQIPTESILHNEIDELIALIEYRPGVLNESLIQRDGVLDYFRGVLSFSKESHPYTLDLAQIALRVGQFVAVHYKRKFRIPRPSYLAPALMPPIDPPGHASWPSAHATEAHLLALCLKEVMPAAAYDERPQSGPEASPLDRMAERIARNREVLGVHYPTDSRAGKEYAKASFDILLECPSLQGDQGILELAREEWKPTTIGP